ncbi:MAG: phosphatase PAP2 family protein [Candidatus Nanoarchaeia archaeon]
MKINKKLIYVNIISLIVFILILLLVKLGLFLKLDLSINSLMPLIQTNFLTILSKIIWFIFDTKSMIIITLLISVWLWYKDSKKDSIFFTTTMILNALVIFVIKLLTQISRPLNSLITETDFAFPSGHVTTAVVFFGILTYLFVKKNKNIKIISIFMILLIAFTRLYLNSHWFSDVLGGFALGLFILTLCIIIYKKWQI